MSLVNQIIDRLCQGSLVPLQFRLRSVRPDGLFRTPKFQSSSVSRVRGGGQLCFGSPTVVNQTGPIEAVKYGAMATPLRRLLLCGLLTYPQTDGRRGTYAMDGYLLVGRWAGRKGESDIHWTGASSTFGRPGLLIFPAWLGVRPASARASRSRYSICALVLRSSSAAQRASASCTAGSRRKSTLLRSVTERLTFYWYSEPALTTCWVACSLQSTTRRLETMAAFRSSSRSTTSCSWSR